MSEEKDFTPTWRYGPEGAAKICYSEKEIPAGWEDHPSKVKEPKPKKEAAKKMDL